jgi:hypothetical protein
LKKTKKTKKKKPANPAKAAKSKKRETQKGDAALRKELAYLLKGGGAHVHFMDALEGFPEGKRGTYAQGLPHTGWQLLEHARLAQWDILEFSRNPKHVSPDFPEAYRSARAYSARRRTNHSARSPGPRRPQFLSPGPAHRSTARARLLAGRVKDERN